MKVHFALAILVLLIQACGGERIENSTTTSNESLNIGVSGPGTAGGATPGPALVDAVKPYKTLETKSATLYYHEGERIFYYVQKDRVLKPQLSMRTANLGFLPAGASLGEKCEKEREYVTKKNDPTSQARSADLYTTLLQYMDFEPGVLQLRDTVPFNEDSLLLEAALATGVDQHFITIIPLNYSVELVYPKNSFIKASAQQNADYRRKRLSVLEFVVLGLNRQVTLGELCDLISPEFRVKLTSNQEGITIPDDVTIRVEL